MSTLNVLVTGGAGQLGAFLVRQLVHQDGVETRPVSLRVGYTYNSADIGSAEKEFGASDDANGGWRMNDELKATGCEGVKGFKVDLGTGEGLLQCIQETKPDFVINTAAVARPKLCEDEPEMARAVNVPSKLVEALKEANLRDTFIMHISTDLVYDGATSELYTESSPTNAVNMYGQSKVDSETYLEENWPAHTCLRSSMIYGRAPENEKCTFFTDFVNSRLLAREPTDFFTDEFRSPIYIGDFATVAKVLLNRLGQARKAGKPAEEAIQGVAHVYNFGGPDRLSRFEMAQQICKHNNQDAGFIVESSAASFDRGVKSPLDTGMDSSKIAKDLSITLTSFSEGLDIAFPEFFSS
mmetsp:Transcript_19955/g.39189  ORF Transcript_19955/g.39189 Transcript_19955/m.39189 type:complete len:354 (+) Transcript_19955:34-1095(+)